MPRYLMAHKEQMAKAPEGERWGGKHHNERYTKGDEVNEKEAKERCLKH